MTDYRTQSEQSAPAPVQSPAPYEADSFDDGLVHDHGWACSERGQPA